MSINETNKKLEQEAQQIKLFMDKDIEEKKSLIGKRNEIQLKIFGVDSKIKSKALSNYFIRSSRKRSAMFLIAYPTLGILSSIVLSQIGIWILLLSIISATILAAKEEYTIKDAKIEVKYLKTLNLEEKIDSLYEELDNIKDLIKASEKHYNELNRYYDILIKKSNSTMEAPLPTMYFEKKEFKIEKPKVKTLGK